MGVRKARFGVSRFLVDLYIPIPSGAAAAEWATDLDLGFDFEVEKAIASTRIAATGVGATRAFRVLKGASTVVASKTIALADMSDLGEQSVFTVTDDGVTNRFRPGDLLSVDSPAAGAVEFTAGAFGLTLVCRTFPQTKT